MKRQGRYSDSQVSEAFPCFAHSGYSPGPIVNCVRPCLQQRGLLPDCTAFPFHPEAIEASETIGTTKIGKTNLCDGLEQSVNCALDTGVDRKRKTAG